MTLGVATASRLRASPPRRLVVGAATRRALGLLLIASVSSVHCHGGEPETTSIPPTVATARAFLERLDREPAKLTAVDPASDAERRTFEWLREATTGPVGDECIGFVARRLDPRAEDSAALRLHRRKGYPELGMERHYVELQCLRAVSDPEIHCIIDLDAMEVVSILADGGA